MNDIVRDTAQQLQPNQIVCLEHHNNCLYGEAIDLVTNRGLCWFRPVCLVLKFDGGLELEPARLIDLQSGSDLLWPAALFRPALDTEVIDYLPQLKDDRAEVDKISNKQYLNQFVRQVWQENQDKFFGL